MAFTNIYDDTFPSDTELANLIGSNLRQVRLDVQQRMAAISGLDAAKPNFAGDAQPANWTGILFFATDSGQIYQFNGATWTNVTANISSGKIFLMGVGGFGVTGSTTTYSPLTTPFSTTEASAQQIMSVNGVFRSLYISFNGSQPATGSLVVTLRINGASTAIQVIVPASSTTGVFSDTAHTASFSAGNLVDYQVVNNATTTSGSFGGASLGY